MALREFTDGKGRRWRVWDIRPDQLHGATRAEDYLQAMIHGWLAFEPAGGGEKRRLSPIPAGWEKASDAELEAMLDRAERTQTETPTGAREAFKPTARQEPLIMEPAPTIRTFRYPSGRYWTVNEQIETTAAERQRLVLRFTSGARALETRNWPHEWARLPEEELAELLYRTFPRNPSAENPTGYRRRRGDLA